MLENLSELIIKINNKKETEELFESLFTQKELETLQKRWRILELLKEGLTQREIAKELNVSLCKVTRGARILKNKNTVIGNFLNIKEK